MNNDWEIHLQPHVSSEYSFKLCHNLRQRSNIPFNNWTELQFIVKQLSAFTVRSSATKSGINIKYKSASKDNLESDQCLEVRIRPLTSPSEIQSWLVSVQLPADGPVSQPTDPPRYSIRFLFISHTYKKHIAFSSALINFTDYLPYIWYNTNRDKILFLRKTISRRNKTTEWLYVALGLPTIHETSHNRVLGWEKYISLSTTVWYKTIFRAWVTSAGSS